MTTPYKVGQEYIARLSSDDGSPELFGGKKKHMWDCKAVIESVHDDKMVVSVFSDIWRKHDYTLDGVRFDGEAYLVENR